MPCHGLDIPCDDQQMACPAEDLTRYLGPCGTEQLMFAIWRRAVAPVVRGAHNFLDWRGLAWLIEVSGLAKRSEGFGGRAGRALSIKVRGSC